MRYGVLIFWAVVGCSQIIEFDKECDVDSDCSSFLICYDDSCVEPESPPPACRILYGLSDETDFHNKSALRIGLMLPRAGELESDGGIMEKVIGTAVFELNQKGGVSGRNLVVISCDSSGDPDELVERATWLVEQARVPILIGPLYGETALRVFRNVAQRSRVLQISPQLLGEPSGFNSDDGLLLKVVSPETSQFDAMVKVLNARGYENVAVLRPDNDQGTRLFQLFNVLYCGRSDCENKPLLDMIYGAARDKSRASFSMGEINSAVSDFMPDAIIFVGTMDEFMTLAEQENALGSLNDRPIFGTHLLHDVISLQTLAESQGEALINQLIGFRPASLVEAAYGDFSNWFSARFPGTPLNLHSTVAFDSIFLAACLYASAGSLNIVDGVSLAKQLSRLTQGEESIQIGLETFGPTRDLLQSNVSSTVGLIGSSGPMKFGDNWTTQSAIDAWYYDVASGQIRSFGEILSSGSEYQEGVLPDLGTR